MKAPFKRGQKLVYTDADGNKQLVKYVRWWGRQVPSLVDVQDKTGNHIGAVHVESLAPFPQ